MKAIIHVGDMKAGSKSIQAFVSANEEKLHEDGILVSRRTRAGVYHSMLASYALDEDRLKEIPRREWGITDSAQVAEHRAAVERTISDELANAEPQVHTVLFSHEGLLYLHAPEIERLVKMLRRHFSECRIVAYIRRQDRHMISMWGQGIKAGRVSQDNLLRRCSRRGNYHYRGKRGFFDMLCDWEEAVGRDCLSVRLLEPQAFQHGCLHRDFCAAASIPWNPKFDRPKPANVGINRVAQRFLLALNASLAGKSGPEARRGAVVPFLERFFTGTGIKPPLSWAKEVMNFFAEENEKIRRRYFPERPTLFDSDFSSYPEEGSSECTAQEAMDLAVTVWRHCQRGPTTAEIQEAYRLVLGRDARTDEVAKQNRDTASIRRLYVTLLESQEYHQKTNAVQGKKDAA